MAHTDMPRRHHGLRIIIHTPTRIRIRIRTRTHIQLRTTTRPTAYRQFTMMRIRMSTTMTTICTPTLQPCTREIVRSNCMWIEQLHWSMGQ
jgi:hypothetical protein